MRLRPKAHALYMSLKTKGGSISEKTLLTMDNHEIAAVYMVCRCIECNDLVVPDRVARMTRDDIINEILIHET